MVYHFLLTTTDAAVQQIYPTATSKVLVYKIMASGTKQLDFYSEIFTLRHFGSAIIIHIITPRRVRLREATPLFHLYCMD